MAIIGAARPPGWGSIQELRVVRDYLDIEHVRFGDRLRYRFEVPDDVSQMLVPRLSVQTLVENSVKYAVSPSRDGASIGLTASASDGRLHVAIEDDGPGFDASHLPEGHGLQLLKSRLAMTFGDRASLRFICQVMTDLFDQLLMQSI